MADLQENGHPPLPPACPGCACGVTVEAAQGQPGGQWMVALAAAAFIAPLLFLIGVVAMLDDWIGEAAAVLVGVTGWCGIVTVSKAATGSRRQGRSP